MFNWLICLFLGHRWKYIENEIADVVEYRCVRCYKHFVKDYRNEK